MVSVSAEPSGWRGGETSPKGATSRPYRVKTAASERRSVTLMTSTERPSSPDPTSHIGSPARESCMTVGRRLKPSTTFW